MSKQLIERLRGFKDTPRTADNLCHEAGDRIEDLERELSACQADRLRMRTALNAAQDCIEFYGHPGSKLVAEALATPTGDLSALREVCAKVLEEVQEGICTITLARHIREGTWNPEVLK